MTRRHRCCRAKWALQQKLLKHFGLHELENLISTRPSYAVSVYKTAFDVYSRKRNVASSSVSRKPEISRIFLFEINKRFEFLATLYAELRLND